MSSICGVLQRDGGPVGRGAVQRMVDALAESGPDAAGVWANGVAGLGHAMLRTTPEALDEVQPWTSPDGLITITADARLDNRDELSDVLGVSPPLARRMPDCAFIAEAYRKWAASCPEFLVGDFAFAVWDAREQHLFCARDFVGIKPFYYFEDRDRFLFATEIKSLFAHPAQIPRVLKERRLAELLIRAEGDWDSCVYEHVRALPAAHSLTVSAHGSQRRRYWTPDPRREIRLAGDEAYAEAYREVLQRAVVCRLRTPYPVGTTLSEGLDSSAISWFARQAAAASQAPLVGLSWASHLDQPRHLKGDGRYADRFLSAAPMEHGYVYVDLARVFTPGDELFRFHDGPIHDRRFSVMTDTFGAAAERGARVILFGLGGDEVATSPGPDYLLTLLMRGQVGRLAGEIRAQAQINGGSKRGIIHDEILLPLLQSTPRRPSLTYERTGVGWPEQPAGTAAFLARVPNLGRRTEPELSDAVSWGNLVRANQIGLMRQGRFQHAMETRYYVSAKFGVECRFPMLDRRLVEFCLALPPEQHRSEGWSRRLVRKAMGRDLGDHVTWNPRKIGGRLGDAWAHYEGTGRGLRSTLTRWRGCQAVREYIDLDRMEHLLDACIAKDKAAPAYFEKGFLFAAFLDWTSRQGSRDAPVA